MDIRTGKTYETREAAEADGVPPSDIAEIVRNDAAVPSVRFASGPFKNRTYKRAPNGQLIRSDVVGRGFIEKYDGSGRLVKVRS